MNDMAPSEPIVPETSSDTSPRNASGPLRLLCSAGPQPRRCAEAWLIEKEDEKTVLKAGDTIAFPANRPYAFRVVSDQTLRLLGTHMSPTRMVLTPQEMPTIPAEARKIFRQDEWRQRTNGICVGYTNANLFVSSVACF